MIPEGTHTHNFSVHIPESVPPSRNEEFGRIVYKARVKIDRAIKHDEFAEEFTVRCPIDLNLNPALTVACHREVIKHFCCLCCRSQPVVCNFKIEKTGFVPEEEVRLKAHINNPSNIEIVCITIEIFKKITYGSDTPECRTKECEVCVFMDGTRDDTSLKNGSRDYDYTFRIPNITSSIANPRCRVLQIYHVLKLKAMVFLY